MLPSIDLRGFAAAKNVGLAHDQFPNVSLPKTASVHYDYLPLMNVKLVAVGSNASAERPHGREHQLILEINSQAHYFQLLQLYQLAEPLHTSY